MSILQRFGGQAKFGSVYKPSAHYDIIYYAYLVVTTVLFVLCFAPKIVLKNTKEEEMYEKLLGDYDEFI